MGVFLVMGRSDLRPRRRSAGLHGRDKHEGYAGVTDAQGERGYAGCSADRIECNDASEQCSQHDGRVEVMVRPVS